MKKSFRLPLIAAACLLAVLSSCNKEVKQEPEKPVYDLTIKAFSFTVEKNPALAATIEGKIETKDITLGMPQTTDLTSLVATFTTADGNKVTVGDVEQVNGTTANDFSEPVDYIVTSSDGKEHAIYTVSINKVKGEWKIATAMTEAPVYSGILKVNPVDNLPYLAFRERSVTGAVTETADKITVKRLKDGVWENVGSAGFTEKASEPLLDFDKEGKPYVAFINPAKSVTVMRYEGSNWTSVGEMAIAPLTANKITFGVKSSNDILAGFVNNANGAGVARHVPVIMKWDGSNWNTVSVAAGASLPPTYMHITCKSGDDMYYASINRGKMNEVNYGNNVIKYASDGTIDILRNNFLQEGATQTGITTFDIAAREDGTVYLASSDNALDNAVYRIRVEKYDPASKAWSTVGGNPIEGAIDKYNNARIALAPDGTIFLIYRKNATNDMEAMSYDLKTKEWSAPVVVSSGNVDGELCLCFDKFGTGYVGFNDTDKHYQVYKFE